MAVSDFSVARLRCVSKAYGNLQALDKVDLVIRNGETLALLGPNGAGKSTAIGILLGLIHADEGRALLFGRDPSDIVARRQIGVMLQATALPPTLRVGELVHLFTSYYPDPRQFDETVDIAGLRDLLKRPYASLSGGQQRSVQFALAVCGRPRLLFLDEPTVGMDIETREKLWDGVRTLVGTGVSVVLTTHYLEEAEVLAERVAVLNEGRVISDGTVTELRGQVAMAHVRCATSLAVSEVASWPHVQSVDVHDGRLSIRTMHPEVVTIRLVQQDPNLSMLEVERASLADAFQQLIQPQESKQEAVS